MKKRLLYMLVVLGGIFSGSCESYLEEVPQNKLKPNTTDDYDQLLNYGYLTEQVVPYLDILSDDVDLIASDHSMEGDDYGDVYVAAYMWNKDIETTMPGGDIAFEKFYQSVFYANVVLENIDQAAGMELNEVNVERTRQNIKGEAYALRAYSHFYLVNLYAKPYDPETCATDPGIPLNLSTAAEDKAYTRNSVKEVYDLIVGDLKEGVQLMEANPVSKPAKLKSDALSARALLARVYLYMQQWDSAIVCAEQVIRENPAIFNLYEAGLRLSMDNNFVSSWNASTVWGKDYLAKDNDIKVIECNLRASRSFPFVSKVLKINFIELATKVMLGLPVEKPEKNLFELDYVGIKASQFSFNRLQKADPVLGVDMASTGEVGCIGMDTSCAVLKAMLSVGYRIPKKNILLSTGTMKQKADMMDAARMLVNKGYKLFATGGTHKALAESGIESTHVYWPSEEGHPQALEMLHSKEIDMVVNIPKNLTAGELSNGYKIRRAAIDLNIPLITNARLASAFINAFCTMSVDDIAIKSWAEYK